MIGDDRYCIDILTQEVIAEVLSGEKADVMRRLQAEGRRLELAAPSPVPSSFGAAGTGCRAHPRASRVGWCSARLEPGSPRRIRKLLGRPSTPREVRCQIPAEGRAQRSRHEPTVRDGAVRDQWPRETCLPEPRPGPAPGRVPPRPVSPSQVRGQPLAVTRRGPFERERLPQLARATRRATSDGASVWASATARYQRGTKSSPLPVSTAATIRSPTNAGLTTAR